MRTSPDPLAQPLTMHNCWQPVTLFQIRGTDTSNARELHIAYRYGEHYDSVRKINDNSEAPARLQTEVGSADQGQLYGCQSSLALYFERRSSRALCHRNSSPLLNSFS